MINNSLHLPKFLRQLLKNVKSLNKNSRNKSYDRRRKNFSEIVFNSNNLIQYCHLTKFNFLSQRGIEANCWRERNKIVVKFRIVP